MSTSVLELRGVRVRTGEREVLAVEEFQLAPGEWLGLMGPNGAGKSTLLRVCLGWVRSVAGTVRVLGEDLNDRRGAALAALRRRLGYLPQLLPARSELPLTVREVVAIGRTARAGLGRRMTRSDWAMVDNWLERLGLGALAGRAFHELSGGEQRKVMLARAMAQEPELLLLDEPAANLDLGWREQLVAELDRLHQQTGLAAVLVCHEPEVLPPACRRVVWLDAGRVAASGPPEMVLNAERLHRLYGRGLRVLHFQGRHAVVPEGYDA
jgi:ABC-type Mn2+/Zn2+ transport system ATPase subunit